MLGLVSHSQVCPMFSKITKQQHLLEGLRFIYLFVACSYMSTENTLLACCFSWVWFVIPKVLRKKSLEKVEWFSLFFACSFLYFVRYLLKLQKYAFWAGIVRHRLSANQIFRCFELKNLENYMRCQGDFLLPLKLQKFIAISGYYSKYSWPISLQDFWLLISLTCWSQYRQSITT